MRILRNVMPDPVSSHGWKDSRQLKQIHDHVLQTPVVCANSWWPTGGDTTRMGCLGAGTGARKEALKRSRNTKREN